MKKYIFILISLFISNLCVWSVWEGNGIAGIATDFQEDGMFVKSSLFPKYTLIEIVNLENDIKARAIVLEGKEVPGILVSFSPSVAEALKVQYGEVTRIRISSPSLTSDDVASSLYLPKEEPTPEPAINEASKLAMKERMKEKEEMSSKDAHSVLNDDVILYDFKPIAKPTEKIERKDGTVSFDPAFIEEDVKLDLHIPATPIAPAKEMPKKAPSIIPAKEPMPAPKIVEKPKASYITPPKTITTPSRPIYLEDTSLRPPKEVSSIIMKENKTKQEEPVKDVVMIEKKKKEEPRLFINVDEVDSIKEPSKEKDEKVAPVGEVKDVEKKPTESPKKPEKVQEASQIKEPVEEKKEEIKGVGEVSIPKETEKEKDVVLPTVIELPQVVHAPDEEKETVEPVSTVDIPKKPEENNEGKEKEVPLVESIKEKPIEDTPAEQEQKEEPAAEEEPAMEETQEDLQEAEPEEPIEEIQQEPLEAEPKELDEMPLREINVRNAIDDIEEEPSKETTVLPKKQEINALDETTIEEKKAEEIAKQTEKEPILPKEEAPKTEEQAPKIEEKPIVTQTPQKANTKENFSTGKTVKGASYVQIAVYGNSLAVEDLLKKYSGQYPITVEKKEERAGTKYIVFIGPLQKDEIGAIQERFQSFGFQDCFLK
ncbi:MAG: SPOR domain-containing protein [Treponema sp.]